MNNNDLISRSALLKEIGTARYYSIDPYNQRGTIFKMVATALPVDAEPVKHGIWEEEPYIWRCSECHKWIMLEQGDAEMNFCTHCGARMDGRME